MANQPSLAKPADLRRQAKLFEQAARKLFEAADLLDGGTSSPGSQANSSQSSDGGSASKVRRGSRLPQLKRVLREHGPLLRKEIVKKSELPAGTVAYLLKRENGFVQDDDGRWRLADDPEPKNLPSADDVTF